jgi:hypothetical protein
MNSMIDFVSSYHLFMNGEEEKEKEKPQEVELQENNEMDLYNKEKPKFRKKPLKQIFNMKKK